MANLNPFTNHPYNIKAMTNLDFLERDSKKPFTKKEAIKLFRYIYKIKAESLGYSRGDEVAKRTEWNDYTDALCKDGLITTNQYNNWSHPF